MSIQSGHKAFSIQKLFKVFFFSFELNLVSKIVQSWLV